MGARNSKLAALSSAAAIALALGQPAHATTVATISGSYDLLAYDTAGLTFHNTSGGMFTNVKMVLTGYQPGTLNFGATKTVPLADMGAGDTNVVWGSIPGQNGATTSGNLTAYDYDDEWGNTPAGFTDPSCVIVASLCSPVGNFNVVFTALISGGAFNGSPVFSVFSPTSNFTGGFVGWEGLNQAGISESGFDQHSGSLTGVMAVIDIGLPPGIPEPATWAMMLLGFGALGGSLRIARRKQALAA